MSDTERMVDAESLARKGIRMAGQGKSSEAVACLERAVGSAPDHAFGQLHLGMALSGLGRFDEAEEHLRHALALKPENPAFHLFAGVARFDSGHYDEAGKAFDRVMALSPQNDLAQGYHALTRWAAGNRDVADTLIPDELPESTAFLARLLILIELDLLGRHVDYVDHSGPAPILDRWRIAYQLWRAGLDFKKGLFDLAAMRTEMIMELRPGHPAAVAFQKTCRDSARAAAERRVAESPDKPELRIDLAAQLADNEVYDEAADQLNQADSLMAETPDEKPTDSSMVLRLRARIAFGQGRIDEAALYTEQGAEPGFSMAETQYYRALCHLAKGNRHSAIAPLEALVAKVCWAVPIRLREYRTWRTATR